VVNIVEIKICNVCNRKAIIKAAKRIFNSDKICPSYCDFNFGVTFLEHSVVLSVCVNYLQHCEKRKAPVFNLLRGRF